jgi:hypothetical protein
MNTEYLNLAKTIIPLAGLNVNMNLICKFISKTAIFYNQIRMKENDANAFEESLRKRFTFSTEFSTDVENAGGLSKTA